MKSIKKLFRYPTSPEFVHYLKDTLKRVRLIVSSAIFSTIMGLVLWAMAYPGFHAFILCIIVFLAAILIIACGRFFLARYKYIRRIENDLQNIIEMFIYNFGIKHEGPKGNYVYSIDAITEEHGNVALVLAPGSAYWFDIGTVLAVIETDTERELGSVEIYRLSTNEDSGAKKALAKLCDRKRTEFWEHLEDRMKTNFSPPHGVHLEPYVLTQLGEIINPKINYKG
ncbi:hypothetical protein KA005_73780 [bacterium]|nr:hypothetical protein [bacterium]